MSRFVVLNEHSSYLRVWRAAIPPWQQRRIDLYLNNTTGEYIDRRLGVGWGGGVLWRQQVSGRQVFITCNSYCTQFIKIAKAACVKTTGGFLISSQHHRHHRLLQCSYNEHTRLLIQSLNVNNTNIINFGCVLVIQCDTGPGINTTGLQLETRAAEIEFGASLITFLPLFLLLWVIPKYPPSKAHEEPVWLISSKMILLPLCACN